LILADVMFFYIYLSPDTISPPINIISKRMMTLWYYFRSSRVICFTEKRGTSTARLHFNNSATLLLREY